MAAEYPQALESLIDELGRLPGIGKRTAERLAMNMVEWDAEDLRELGNRIASLRDLVKHCTECGNLADGERCRVCTNPNRERTTICVVEQARQIPVIEKCGRFGGVYHVLGGRLSPLEGIEPDDLNIEQLFKRIEEEGVQEIILSTSSDVEGEATAAYLAHELQERFELTVSRIASGIPVGADLSYADSATMAMALDSRRKM